MNKQDVILLVLVGIICIMMLVVPVTALTITNGVMITTPGGATSPVITITDYPIAQNGTLTIDVSDIKNFLAHYSLTGDNVAIHSNATLAVWTSSISGDSNILTLTSMNSSTELNETVTVTFRGTPGNPWGDSDMLKSIPIAVTRTDGHGDGSFTFEINTTLPQQGLTIMDGATITTPDGATSPVITITDSPIAQNGCITLDVSYLKLLVASNTFTDANVEISSNARSAVWTKSVSGDGNTLTLMSTHGPTAVNEAVTVTFTGAGGNPWLARSGGLQAPILTATRSDGNGARDFTFRIETVPSGDPVADFSASPTLDIAPLTVLFTDTSPGSPISWNWNFGDGGTSTSQNPSHTYTNAGKYTVSLIATYAPEGQKMKTQSNYISVLNGAVRVANTSVPGLTVTNCSGLQTITVDTNVLSAALIPNNSVLEIQPPADRGFKNITIYAMNGIGFLRNGNLLTGNPTAVRLVSEEIRPSPGFSNTIGTTSSFNYSIDLSSFPCNALLSTKIWEGEIPEYNTKLYQIASGNLPPAVPVGTAYTAKITRTNFPSGTPAAEIHMTVNSSWSSSIFGEHVFIWQLADDGNSGQILPTQYLYNDPVKHIDFFKTDSTLGFSTFGISSFTGSNNPFQLITFAIIQAVNAPDSSTSTGNNDNSAAGTGAGAGKATGPVTVQNVNPPKALAPPDPGKTEKIYTNANGVITQATQLQSADQLAQISIGLGVVAKDRTGAPLSSVTLTALPAESLPSTTSLGSYTFAGMAYEFSPSGATFSPPVSLSFIYPEAKWGEEFTVKTFESQSGTWQDLPTTRDPSTGRITAQISHFCCIALFAKSTAVPNPSSVSPTITPLPLKAPPSPPAPTVISNFAGMMMWVVNLMAKNLLIIAGVIILITAIFLYGRKRRRDKWRYLL